MRGVIGLTIALCVVSAQAQESTDYTASENPFSAEYAFVAAQPITLRVDIAGVRFDAVTLTPKGEVSAAVTVECAATMSGNSVANGKVNVVTVLVLEDADSRTLQKITLDVFKVKSGREFRVDQGVKVPGAALAAAARIYLFIKVES